MSCHAVYINDYVGIPQYQTKKVWSVASPNTGNLVHNHAVAKTTGCPVLSHDELLSCDIKDCEFDTVITTSLIFIGKNREVGYKDKLSAIKEKFGEKIKIIPLCVGLDHNFIGEFSFSKSMTNLLKSISERCNIACRGEITADVLSKIGIKNTIVLGCPSLFYHEDDSFGIHVKDFHSDFKLVTNANLGPSSSVKMSDIKQFIDFIINNKAEFINQVPFNGYWFDLSPDGITPDAYMNWLWNHKVFFELKPWLNYMRNFDFVMGGAFHGSVAGILAKVPALVLNYDGRVGEICRYFNIPMIPFNNFDSNKSLLYYYQKTDYSLFNSGYKEKFNRYFDYLKENGIYNK